MKRILLSFVLIWIFGCAEAQSDLEALMAARGEYYFSIEIQQHEEAAQLTRLCSIDRLDGLNLICYANAEQYQRLLAKGYHPTLLTPPSMEQDYAMWDGSNREAYDLSGKLIYNQQISDNITSITTTSWPSGTYIWKVIANGKEAESGKWVKE